jgi:hypothetical protein
VCAWRIETIVCRVPFGYSQGAYATAESLLQKFGSTTIASTAWRHGRGEDVQQVGTLATHVEHRITSEQPPLKGTGTFLTLVPQVAHLAGRGLARIKVMVYGTYLRLLLQEITPLALLYVKDRGHKPRLACLAPKSAGKGREVREREDPPTNGPLPNPPTRGGSGYNRLMPHQQNIILPSLVEGQGGGSGGSFGEGPLGSFVGGVVDQHPKHLPFPNILLPFGYGEVVFPDLFHGRDAPRVEGIDVHRWSL